MTYSAQIKPISYLKTNAAEVLARLAQHRQPLVITQNGEAKAVLQDVKSFDENQDQDVAAGKVRPVADVVARVRTKQTT